jgi:hypothetical protein
MSPRYNRLPWKPVNKKQFDVRLSSFGPGTSSVRYKTETARTLYGRIKDGRQSRICYRQRRAHDQEKNPTSKHSVQYGAVCNYWNNPIGENSRHEIVIITDSLSKKMAAESHTPTKNPKTQTIRKMLDQEGPKITLIWVPSNKEIPGNEKADQSAKEALDEDIPTTGRYPLDDLKKWLKRISKKETKDRKTETTR